MLGRGKGSACHAHSLTSAKDNYYVALSRAQHEAKIYTDDRERLPKAMRRENVKELALEVHQRERQTPSLPREANRPLPAKEKTRERRMEWEMER